MQSTQINKWLATAALLPLLAGGLATGCDDDDTSSVTDGAAGTGGGTGGSVGTGGTGGGTGGSGGGGVDAAAMGGEAGGCPAETLVTADVTVDTTWSCPVYVLKQKVYVTGGKTLTIAAGTIVKGDAAAADKPALIVSRGSQLVAMGTASNPVVFTSGNAPGARKGGDWAGVALLGDAKINTGVPCAAGGAGCLEAGIEGIAATELRAKFGGLNDGGSCGQLSYVRIEFAGAELEPNKELNGLTLGGCGSGTKLSHIQVHRGTDDGIEFFGGTASMDHVVLSGNEDDSLDWDYGWTGKAQFVVIHQRAGVGDWGIEGAGSPTSEVAEPRTAPALWNLTMIGRAAGGKAVVFKEGSRGKIYNSIIQGWTGDVVDVVAKTVMPAMEWPMFVSIENTLFWMNGMYAAEVAGMPSDDDMGFPDQMSVEAPAQKNQTAVDPMLTGITDLSAATPEPNYVPKNAAVGNQATPPAGLDASATYAGAFAPNATTLWTAGWTAFPIN